MASIRSPPQMDTFFDITGSRVRPGPFASTSALVDALRNQGIFGNMGELWGGSAVRPCGPPSLLAPSPAQGCSIPPGKINAEEIQRSVQKIMEQYTSTLKIPR